MTSLCGLVLYILANCSSFALRVRGGISDLYTPTAFTCFNDMSVKWPSYIRGGYTHLEVCIFTFGGI